jgi:Uma2 family endonuclease
MPATLTLPQTRRQPYRWTTTRCERLMESGLFPEWENYKLIAGELLEKPRESAAHAFVNDAVYELLARTLNLSGAFLRGAHPVQLQRDTAPEPDLAVIAGQRSAFTRHHPGPGDVLLLIEISSSILEYDRTDKATLYARHNIPEFWLVNLKERQLEVFRTPLRRRWTEKFVLGPDDTIAPLFSPETPVSVRAMLPPT